MLQRGPRILQRDVLEAMDRKSGHVPRRLAQDATVVTLQWFGISGKRIATQTLTGTVRSI